MSALVDTRGDYRDLFDVYAPIGVAVLVLIWMTIVVLAVRYRRREPGPPPDEHERPRAEGAYVALLAAVCAFLVTLTFHVMGREGPGGGVAPARASGAGGAPLTIDATASRWNWRFTYPQQRVTQVGTGNAIPTLVVPVGNVRFRLTSLDVIHAFYIPSLRFKRDAFPNRTTTFVLGFDRPGYEQAGGECAEFCGLRHAYMQFDVRVLPRPAFDRWARARRAGRPRELTPALDRRGEYR